MGEPGEWQHGWQYWASSISVSFCRKTSLLPTRQRVKYPELVAGRRCRLVIVAIETGGRWDEAVDFIAQLACTCTGQQSTHGSDGRPGCSQPCAPSLLWSRLPNARRGVGPGVRRHT